MAEEAAAGLQTLSVEENKEREWLQSQMLGKVVRATLTDGRVIIGKVACIDHLGNIVLFESDEFIPSLALSRYLSSIIIPDRHISQLELQHSKSPNAS